MRVDRIDVYCSYICTSSSVNGSDAFKVKDQLCSASADSESNNIYGCYLKNFFSKSSFHPSKN